MKLRSNCQVHESEEISKVVWMEKYSKLSECLIKNGAPSAMLLDTLLKTHEFFVTWMRHNHILPVLNAYVANCSELHSRLLHSVE